MKLFNLGLSKPKDFTQRLQNQLRFKILCAESGKLMLLI